MGDIFCDRNQESVSPPRHLYWHKLSDVNYFATLGSESLQPPGGSAAGTSWLILVNSSFGCDSGALSCMPSPHGRHLGSKDLSLHRAERRGASKLKSYPERRSGPLRTQVRSCQDRVIFTK